jgi:hypothetical protein
MVTHAGPEGSIGVSACATLRMAMPSGIELPRAVPGQCHASVHTLPAATLSENRRRRLFYLRPAVPGEPIRRPANSHTAASVEPARRLAAHPNSTESGCLNLGKRDPLDYPWPILAAKLPSSVRAILQTPK